VNFKQFLPKENFSIFDEFKIASVASLTAFKKENIDKR